MFLGFSVESFIHHLPGITWMHSSGLRMVVPAEMKETQLLFSESLQVVKSELVLKTGAKEERHSS